MNNKLGNLKNRIRLFSDEEVVRMLTSDRNQYLKDALYFADEEAKKRGLNFDVSHIVKSENKRNIDKKESLSGIGGWDNSEEVMELINSTLNLQFTLPSD